jgi:hypothetical protein
MRRTVISLLAVGVLAFAGCSDSDNDPGTGADSADGAGGDDSAFCDAFEELIGGGTDVSNDEALETIRSVEPPEEIADDYAIFVEQVEMLSNSDPNDPEAVEEFQERNEEFSEASDAVQGYVEDDCGIDTSGGADTTAGASDDAGTSDTSGE